MLLFRCGDHDYWSKKIEKYEQKNKECSHYEFRIKYSYKKGLMTEEQCKELLDRVEYTKDLAAVQFLGGSLAVEKFKKMTR